MSLHRVPVTPLEEAGLKAHGLDIGKPSQLSDVFRLGMKWVQVEEAKALEAQNAELLAALVEARESIEYWAIYADSYSREKYNINGDLAKIDAVIERNSK